MTITMYKYVQFWSVRTGARQDIAASYLHICSYTYKIKAVNSDEIKAIYCYLKKTETILCFL